MANNKSPGTDGFPSETYKLYSKPLLWQLLKHFNTALDVGKLPTSMNNAIIVVIPNSGKDKLYPDSYRPISLLNSDVKLLAHVLATKMNTHRLIGFYPHKIYCLKH